MAELEWRNALERLSHPLSALGFQPLQHFWPIWFNRYWSGSLYGATRDKQAIIGNVAKKEWNLSKKIFDPLSMAKLDLKLWLLRDGDKWVSCLRASADPLSLWTLNDFCLRQLYMSCLQKNFVYAHSHCL